MPALPEDPSLPNDIVQSLAIANATAIGAQPAILANLALANQIFNQNLQQQAAVANQQAINLVVLATVARCVSLIAGDTAAGPNALPQLQELTATLKSLQPAERAPAAS